MNRMEKQGNEDTRIRGWKLLGSLRPGCISKNVITQGSPECEAEGNPGSKK